MGSHRSLFGTLIASMDYSVSRAWWGRVMVDHQALKGFNDHYWNELDGVQRHI